MKRECPRLLINKMYVNDQKQTMLFMLRSQQATLPSSSKEPEVKSNEDREVRLEEGTDENSLGTAGARGKWTARARETIIPKPSNFMILPTALLCVLETSWKDSGMNHAKQSCHYHFGRDWAILATAKTRGKHMVYKRKHE